MYHPRNFRLQSEAIESGDFYLFDLTFQFCTGLKRYLNHNTAARGAIDFSIRGALMPFTEVRFY